MSSQNRKSVNMRAKAYQKRQLQRGMVRCTVMVPVTRLDEVRAFAAELRREHLCELSDVASGQPWSGEEEGGS